MAKKPSLTKKKQTKQKTEIALEVKNVSKSFRLPTEQASGIKQAFVNWTRGIKGYKEQKVLQDISFQVEKGDFFGIVGRNGSGKSTLLKLISQIYVPDNGEIKVNGKLVPFIELGVGFNPELTGRENVYLNGALLGFAHEEISQMYDEIVEFAELEEFMDQKLKNYSSGMQVRLAFSIAIKSEAEILVLDEVLAVGDADFQRKCYEYFSKLKNNKKTVILVTHDMESVRQYCNKAMLISDGEIEVYSEDINEVADSYLRLFSDNNFKEEENSNESSRWGTRQMEVADFKYRLTKDELSVSFNLESKLKNVDSSYILALRILDADGTLIAGANTRDMDRKNLKIRDQDKGKKTIEFTMPNMFGRDTIFFGYHLVDLSGSVIYDSADMIAKANNPAPRSFYSIIFRKSARVKG